MDIDLCYRVKKALAELNNKYPAINCLLNDCLSQIEYEIINLCLSDKGIDFKQFCSNSNNNKKMILYHYCEVNVFSKIIKNRKIRFHDILKSTDSKEIKFLFDLYHNFLCDLHPGEEMKAIQFNNAFYNAIKTSSYPCFCLSKNGDSSSMWNDYCNNGGFAIGFKINELKQYFEQIKNYNPSISIKFDKVTYISNQRTKMSDLLCKSLDKDSIKINNFATILDKSMLIKKTDFAYEEEYRIIFKTSSNKKEVSGIKVNDNAPYIYYKHNEKDISFYIPFSPQIIKEIIIGPKTILELSQLKLLSKLIKDHNTIEIKTSNLC